MCVNVLGGMFLVTPVLVKSGLRFKLGKGLRERVGASRTTIGEAVKSNRSTGSLRWPKIER